MPTIGNPAPSQYTINYDALLSTTLFAYREVLVDNVFKSSAFLSALRKNGGIDYQDGGERIAIPLMYGKNETVRSYQGYDLIATTPQEGITTAFYEWKEVGGSITISRREERQNSGEAAILKLLKSKIQQAEMTIKEVVNTMLIQGTVASGTFVPGNNGKDINPLGWFLRKQKATDPVAGGYVGNISAATYDWWRHRVGDFSGTGVTGADFSANVTTLQGLKSYLYRLWNLCSRGGDGSGPDIILMDQVTFETYEMALDAQKRYTDEKMADLGFDNVRLKGGMAIWDELVPDVMSGTISLTYGTAFMINTKFYKLIIDEQTDFVTTPFVEPENQTVRVAKVLFMGNATCSNLRKMGVGIGISQSIGT
jgi:hypothetical protein